MGRSFYKPSPASRIEDFTRRNTYYHQPSNSYFTMSIRDGQIFQRRYQIDSAGAQINVMEKRVDYIMGSGNHARTYLNRTPEGTLVELPLGWYAENGGYWAMNPGYDRAGHEGFRRPITYECMFCHNAYPQIPAGHEQPFSRPVYAGSLPEGIGCQRCHGDGAKHAKLAATGASAVAIRYAIVNPKRLNADRQRELCAACHLESTSFPLPNALARYERAPFSFRPGEPLADFILNFDHAPEARRGDKFEIVSAAYRLNQSACFRKSNGALLCTTCHNPHDVPRGADARRHYDAVCRQCHAVIQATNHAPASDCAACHMPKRRTEDVIHVSVTDHLIQRRKPEGNLLASKAERHETGDQAYRGRVVLSYPEYLPPSPENELLLAVAQVKQRSNLTAGIVQLRAAIDRYKPARAEYDLELAQALDANDQLAEALPEYREAVRKNPASAPSLQKLGTALRRSGNTAEAADTLKRSATLDPGAPLTWHELGLTYRALGRTPDAVQALSHAIQLDADFSEAHNNLGILRLTSGDPAGAEASFREAVRIQPDYADARSNLAGLLSAVGKIAEGREQFVIALQLQPHDARTRYQYAVLLGKAQRYDEAERELQTTLRDSPDFADAHEVLADLLMASGRTAAAIPHYREALRLHPDSMRSHFGLGAALAATDPATAIPHLRQAATASDPTIRKRAEDLLRQLQSPKKL